MRRSGSRAITSVVRGRVLGAVALAAGLVLAGGAASALEAADYFNHLTCFKAKADQKLKGSADLETMLAGAVEFPWDESCTVKKASHVCLTSHASNVRGQIQKQDVEIERGAAGAAQFARICYRIKCKEKPAEGLELRDQFANYELTKLKADLLCGPAFEVCADPTRTVFAGGPNVGTDDGSCQQFDTQQTCEQAWVAQQPSERAAIVPQQCAWSGSSCQGAKHEGIQNSCISCADPGLTQTYECDDFTGTDQGSCEANYAVGEHGLASCYWNPSFNLCRPCGMTQELGLGISPPCVNSCRGG